MLSSTWYALERAAQQLATEVAFYLDEANIPNLLFGWLPMGLVGYRKICTEVDYVINDQQMPLAITALEAAGYHRCTDNRCRELKIDRQDRDIIFSEICTVDCRGGCIHTDTHECTDQCPDDCTNVYAHERTKKYKHSCHRHSVPEAHYHLDSGNFMLSLHLKSSLLWWLPDIQPGPPAADDPDLMLSNDTRLPPRSENSPGPWLGGSHPVKILNATSLTEALMRLFCRDSAIEEDERGVAWLIMLQALKDKHNYGDERNKQLRPKFQYAWESMNWRIPPRQEKAEFLVLRDTLAWENELGPLINGDTYTPPYSIWDRLTGKYRE